MSKWNRNYRMSFTTGGLFLNESIEVARLHERGSNWSDTFECALSDGIMTMPREASNRRILREIITRLKTLSKEDLEFLVHSPYVEDQKNMLWVAVCRTYRIIREFQRDVVNDLYLSGRFDISPYSFNRYLEDVELDGKISEPSNSTRDSLRGALFRMMREADIIGPENQLWRSFLSNGFVNHLVEHDRDAAGFFPGGEDRMPEPEQENDEPCF